MKDWQNEFRREPLLTLRALGSQGDWVPFQWEGSSCLLLNDPDLVEEVLLHEQRSFERSGGPARLQRLLGNGLLRSRDDKHLRQRRLSQPAFLPKAIDRYSKLMARESEAACRTWKPRLDFHQECLRLTLSIATRCFFGLDLSKETSAANTAIQSLPPGRTGLDEKLRKWKFDRALKRLDRTLYRLIDSDSLDPDTLLHSLRATRDLETDGTGMNREELRDELMTLLIAGHETTASALSWAGYLAAKFPQVQSPENARGIFAEALRLYPPAWILLRRALRAVTLSRKKVSAGTFVVISPYLLGRDARLFPDPERCDPFRKREKGFLPFGLGNRRCLGESFAWKEGEVILSTILSHFTLSLRDGSSIHEEAAFTLRPRGGMPLQLHEREKEKILGEIGLADRGLGRPSHVDPKDGQNRFGPLA